jgi:hypothetical protein
LNDRFGGLNPNIQGAKLINIGGLVAGCAGAALGMTSSDGNQPT